MPASLFDPYSNIAKFYDAITARFLAAPRRKTADLCRQFGAGRVLDAGCGTGKQCLELNLRGIDATGVDLSPAMLAVAGKLLSSRNVPLFQASCDNLPFKADEFDAVILSMVLHENANRADAILLEALRLAPLVFILEWKNPERNLDYLLQPAVHAVERLAGKSHYNSFKSFRRKGGAYGLCSGFAWAHEERFRGGSLILLALRRV